ncbi:MAG: DUF938 domain-containing protein [Pseudomonadota bacterium]
MTDDYPSSSGADGKPIALEDRPVTDDGRRYSPSISRNKDVIAEVFADVMPNEARVLEVASGTGEHGAHLTDRLPELCWTYSDIDQESLKSQAAWQAASGHEQLFGPLTLDVTEEGWAMSLLGQFDAIFCANMIHIAPFEAAIGLFKGAGILLSQGGHLMLYGPFARDGMIAPSNANFDESLKRRDRRWGVRDLERDIVPLAEESGLRLSRVIEMPANNLSVIFKHEAP